MVDGTTPGIWFNVEGKTHSLRILKVDRKTDGESHDISVYEAMVDASEYIHFEHEDRHGTTEWDLLSDAIAAYIEYVKDDRTQIRADDRFIKKEEI